MLAGRRRGELLPDHRSRAGAESFEERIFRTRAAACAIVGLLEAAPDFRDQLLLIEPEPSDLGAELSMSNRAAGACHHRRHSDQL